MHEHFRKIYLGFGSGAVLFWSSLTVLVLYTQPHDTSFVTVGVFYLLLMGSFVCTIALLEVLFRKRFMPAPFDQLVKASVRQAALTGLLAVALFVLQSQHLLFWWVAGSLVLLFICVEALSNL